METNTETKQIIIENVKKTKKVSTTTKEKKDRIVTQTKKWNEHFQDCEYDLETQLSFVKDLQINRMTDKNRFLISQIQGKIQGYKTQDIQKNKLDEPKLVDLSFVIEKLIDCSLLCFYCKEPVLVWYKHTREPKQWSLDRIDNDYGHNKNNVEIACLSCNIKRRCMYHDRFRFTKQLNLVKMDHTGYTENTDHTDHTT